MDKGASVLNSTGLYISVPCCSLSCDWKNKMASCVSWQSCGGQCNPCFSWSLSIYSVGLICHWLALSDAHTSVPDSGDLSSQPAPTIRSPYDEMYKAISVLRELFFPQWIQQLKENQVIDVAQSTATAVSSTSSSSTISITSTSSNTTATSTSPSALSTFTTSVYSTTTPERVFLLSTNATNSSHWDEMYASTANTFAQFIQNITFLPGVTFPFPAPWENLFPTTNYTECFNGTGNCTGLAVAPDLGKNYWALILLIFPILTIFGNTLVIMSVFRERSLQTATNYFIVSLACADLLVASMVMPFAVYIEVQRTRWELGDSICDTWIASDVIASTCSIFNLTAISIDRFIAVTQPLKYARHKNHRRVVYTILFVWLVSICIGMPIILGLNVPVSHKQRNPTLCIFYNSDFAIYSSLSSFYIPCILMIGLYYKIFRAIRKRAAKSASNKKPLPPSADLANQHLPLTEQKSNQLPIPVVDKQWMKSYPHINPVPNRVNSITVNNTKGNPDATTLASSSYLDGGEDNLIEDLDVDSGQSGAQSTPPQVTAMSPMENEVSVMPDNALYSPDTETPKRKRTRFLQALSGSLSNDKVLLEENGGPPSVKANNYGKKFNKQKNHRRSIKSREKILAQRERKATKTLAIVLGVFLACWVPFFTISMINAICEKLNIDFPGESVFMVTTWLGYGNSFMNPVIYTVFNEEFRKAFFAILRCKTK